MDNQARIDNAVSHIHAMRGAMQKIVSNGSKPKGHERIVELLHAIEAKLKSDRRVPPSWKDICFDELEIIFEILEIK